MIDTHLRLYFCLAIALLIHAIGLGWAAGWSTGGSESFLRATRTATSPTAEQRPDTSVRAAADQQGDDRRTQAARRAATAQPAATPSPASPSPQRSVTRFVVVGRSMAETPRQPTEIRTPQPLLRIEQDGQRQLTRSAARDARAKYLAAWQDQIEARGSRPYARRLLDTDQSRRLTMAVRVRADGGLAGVRVLRSSGNKDLDAVALAIVRGAAPFAPFEPALRETARELRFAYDWLFEPDGANRVEP